MEKVLTEIERKGLSDMCDTGYAVWRETGCLREDKVSILRRAKIPVVRAICGTKLMDKMNSAGELMNMLGLTLCGKPGKTSRWF